MKLLLLLSLATLALSQEAFVSQKLVESNDVPQGVGVLQTDPHSGLQPDDKKLEKRSHGWGGWHGHGWPSYSHGWHGGHGYGHGYGHGGWGWGGYGGHGWYGGWYPGWPWWQSGWHGHGGHGHGGWHSKW